MTPRTLLQEATPQAVVTGGGAGAVSAVVSDSRAVVDGAMFVALRGLGVDGHKYIEAALSRGARAVVAETDAPPGLAAGLTWARVPSTSAALGPLASAFFGHPSRALEVLAVTGTNGKTSVTWLLEQILLSCGMKPGVLSTVEVRYAGQRRPTRFTTPPADELQALLAAFRDAGCTHAVMEASSHGLVQGRLGGTRVAVGGFTNLTRDHLDYHGTLEAYRDAKRLLFTDLAEAGCFNVDDAVGRELAAAFEGRRRTTSARGLGDADLRVEDLRSGLEGSEATLHTPAGQRRLALRLLGRHNVENALVALGMAELAGVPLDSALAALADASAPPGRLERVPGPVSVVVDYAHTPDALDNVLAALRPLVAGRLICVFGAGGDRDPGKRPEMARAVARLADLAIVTSDNPRTESPDAIVADVVRGMPVGAAWEAQVDRRAAIERAVAMATPGDLVLIAGKGHETTQTIGTVQHPFDDRDEARRALAGRVAR
ncbi:MAG: UDP-N-acetylmuramoyl-L-alanyl-D-glutamate--2,6-diaminopimelate ligase [Deltaproteobacteria bacterium]|nr:UDP-N-acetylmuramoyl-L-alanyl-D-glutamate--2,6-diaminopimelate ligase [Deltaproteobacteria bacterium]